LTQLLIGKLDLKGQPWDVLGALNFSNMGFIVVGAFVVTWIGAFAIFKLRRVDERWAALLEDRRAS
ncbi:MAG TPA: HoxN/HupN/NixA family nickel/cobalt transporter, partial [Candidatus Dormibacteraeota bacterium]